MSFRTAPDLKTASVLNRRQFVTRAGAGIAATGAGLAVASPAAANVPALRFRNLYIPGRQLSPEALSLVGQRITMTGYMAPPLKPEVHFFVLTRMPMATCPFCDDAADWPDDIVLAFFQNDDFEFTRFSNLIRVEGTFDVGIHTDEETGFVSMVRLLDSRYVRV